MQGDAPQPVAPRNHPQSCPPDLASRPPSPYSAAELPHVEAPTSSSPPVGSQPTLTPFKFDASFKAPPSKWPPFKFQVQQQQQKYSENTFEAWQQQ